MELSMPTARYHALLCRDAAGGFSAVALDLGTTGAAYHHLNVLQSADLVTQEGRGVFVVQPHRVSAIFSILAGIESVATASVTEVAKDDGAPDEAELAEANSGGKRKGKKPA